VQFEGATTSQAKPSPLLGEHSRDILAELGWNKESVDALINEGAVVQTQLPE